MPAAVDTPTAVAFSGTDTRARFGIEGRSLRAAPVPVKPQQGDVDLWCAFNASTFMRSATQRPRPLTTLYPHDHDLATCAQCGAPLPVPLRSPHVCDWWEWLDHQVQLRRDELNRFESELGSYLASSRGRFDLWYWERRRLQPGY